MGQGFDSWLGNKDPTGHGATKPEPQVLSLCTLEPLCHNYDLMQPNKQINFFLKNPTVKELEQQDHLSTV